MKNTKSEMKNTVNGINPMWNITEESISKPKDIAKETIQIAAEGGKWKKLNRGSVRQI